MRTQRWMLSFLLLCCTGYAPSCGITTGDRELSEVTRESDHRLNSSQFEERVPSPYPNKLIAPTTEGEECSVGYAERLGKLSADFEREWWGNYSNIIPCVLRRTFSTAVRTSVRLEMPLMDPFVELFLGPPRPGEEMPISMLTTNYAKASEELRVLSEYLYKAFVYAFVLPFRCTSDNLGDAGAGVDFAGPEQTEPSLGGAETNVPPHSWPPPQLGETFNEPPSGDLRETPTRLTSEVGTTSNPNVAQEVTSLPGGNPAGSAEPPVLDSPAEESESHAGKLRLDEMEDNAQNSMTDRPSERPREAARGWAKEDALGNLKDIPKKSTNEAVDGKSEADGSARGNALGSLKGGPAGSSVRDLLAWPGEELFNDSNRPSEDSKPRTQPPPISGGSGGHLPEDPSRASGAESTRAPREQTVPPETKLPIDLLPQKIHELTERTTAAPPRLPAAPVEPVRAIRFGAILPPTRNWKLRPIPRRLNPITG